MKIQIFGTIVTLLALASGAKAHADVAKMAGIWNGNGAVFSLDGNPLSKYQIQLEDTLQSDGSLASNVTVTIPDGPAKHFHQILRDTPKGFSMISDQGSGGAVCLGDGLCEGYFGDSNGNGVAMTFVIDNASHIRLLKTELKNFRAVRLYRESYTREQSN